MRHRAGTGAPSRPKSAEGVLTAEEGSLVDFGAWGKGQPKGAYEPIVRAIHPIWRADDSRNTNHVSCNARPLNAHLFPHPPPTFFPNGRPAAGSDFTGRTGGWEVFVCCAKISHVWTTTRESPDSLGCWTGVFRALARARRTKPHTRSPTGWRGHPCSSQSTKSEQPSIPPSDLSSSCPPYEIPQTSSRHAVTQPVAASRSRATH